MKRSLVWFDSALLILLLVLLFCSTVNALPIRYSVSGEAELGGTFSDSGLVELTGNMYIDDTPIVRSDGHWFTYTISSFDLSVGEFSFSGSSGSIESFYYGSSTTTFDPFGIQGEGDWTQWGSTSANPIFYFKDGTEYDTGPDPSDFYFTPYLITADRVLIDGVPNNMLITDLEISCSNPAPEPVPEPTTILLFGTGIVVLAGSRLRRKQNA